MEGSIEKKKSWIRDSNKKTERETIKEKHGIGENTVRGIKPLGEMWKKRKLNREMKTNSKEDIGIEKEGEKASDRWWCVGREWNKRSETEGQKQT